MTGHLNMCACLCVCECARKVRTLWLVLTTSKDCLTERGFKVEIRIILSLYAEGGREYLSFRKVFPPMTRPKNHFFSLALVLTSGQKNWKELLLRDLSARVFQEKNCMRKQTELPRSTERPMMNHTRQSIQAEAKQTFKELGNA